MNARPKPRRKPTREDAAQVQASLDRFMQGAAPCYGVPPRPAAMGCYFGTIKEGEIVDRCKAGVEAFALRGDTLVKLGVFSSRKAAIAAVSEAAATK